MQSYVEQKGHWKVYNIKFGNLTDLHDYLLSSPPVNTAVFQRQASEKNAFEFSGESLEKSIGYCIGGYTKDFDNFLKANTELRETTKVAYTNNHRLVRSMYGGVPQPALVAAGVPQSMLRYERESKSTVRNIYFNLAYPAFTSTESIINRGLATLYLVQALEARGEMVNFKAFELSKNDDKPLEEIDEIVNLEINLKKPGDHFLNIEKCYYPIRAKEFLRRVLFRVLESSDVEDYLWGEGYGTALDLDEMKTFLNTGPNDLLISYPSEMGIEGHNIYEDTIALINGLNLQKEFDISKIKTLKDKNTRR